MGIQVPPEVHVHAFRVHGRKHWLDYTIGELPSQYHLIVRYDDENGVYCGSAAIIFSPGTIRNALGLSAEDADNKFADIVERYEEGRTPDEITIWMEPNHIDNMIHTAWKSARVVELPE